MLKIVLNSYHIDNSVSPGVDHSESVMYTCVACIYIFLCNEFVCFNFYSVNVNMSVHVSKFAREQRSMHPSSFAERNRVKLCPPFSVGDSGGLVRCARPKPEPMKSEAHRSSSR